MLPNSSLYDILSITPQGSEKGVIQITETKAGLCKDNQTIKVSLETWYEFPSWAENNRWPKAAKSQEFRSNLHLIPPSIFFSKKIESIVVQVPCWLLLYLLINSFNRYYLTFYHMSSTGMIQLPSSPKETALKTSLFSVFFITNR